MLKKIESILDNDIRPFLRSHGGDVKVCSYADGVVELKMLGGCAGCLEAAETKDKIITKTLTSSLPAIKKVIFNDDIDPELLALAKQILSDQTPAFIKH